MSTAKRLGPGRIQNIAGEAVKWIAVLELKRRPIPEISLAPDTDYLKKLVEVEVHFNRSRFQGYDLAMALHQIFELVKHFEEEDIPKEVNDPLIRFLSAMRNGRLIHLRDSLAHRDEVLAGTMSVQDASKKMDTWQEHKSQSLGGEAIAAEVYERAFDSIKRSIGTRSDRGGVTSITVLGREYELLAAFNCALELGPPLSKWSGQLLLRAPDFAKFEA
ncbi:MAG: hypothetical protein IH865_13620 [Chloroflexi bacterium]|nr:hypothetical protein [Chloroflexota bacterium]